MISDWFINAWVGMVGWITGLLPSFSESTTNAGLMGMLAPMADGASRLGAWIPWDVLGFWAPIVIAMYFATLILRVIKSLIPTISG